VITASVPGFDVSGVKELDGKYQVAQRAGGRARGSKLTSAQFNLFATPLHLTSATQISLELQHRFGRDGRTEARSIDRTGERCDKRRE
jgi:hypothetical protein